MATFNYPYIRDILVIGEKVQAFYNGFVGAGPVYLLGRVVEHDAGWNLRVGTKPLVIVADEYHGNGQMIDARGSYPAGSGGSVTVLCQRSIGAHIDVSGTQGADGAVGADGADEIPEEIIEGYFELVWDPIFDVQREVWVPPRVIQERVAGWPAGMGGEGQAGGNAGTLVFTTLEENWPTLIAEGGAGGHGGPGGSLHDVQGDWGNPGRSGNPSTVAYRIVSEDEHHALVSGELGIYKNYWAPFRINVGNYFYHTHNPAVEERSGDLLLAAGEFTAALHFQPDNLEALRLQKQLESGANTLGLPRDLDLLPRFDDYIEAYNGFASLVLSFLSQGNDWLGTSHSIDALTRFASQQILEGELALEHDRLELEVQQAKRKLAGDTVFRAQQRLDGVISEIHRVPPAVMQDEGFSFGDFIGTLAAVGSAVVAIAAAVPTLGASVVALAPSVVMLVDTLSENAEPIVRGLFDDAKLKEHEFDEVKKAYAKVGKNADAIVKGGSSIINFVRLVQNIGSVLPAASDNSRYVALVKQGAEFAHQLMLERSQDGVAELGLAAARAKLSNAERVVESLRQLERDLFTRTQSSRQVGLAAIDIAFAKAHALQTLVFRAQRSVEIYTLKDQARNVSLDAGMIHPDMSRAFYEGEVTTPALANALNASWGKLLNPIRMKLDYVAFFDAMPTWDTYRLSFTSGPEVETFQNTGNFRFRVDATDLPRTHFDTKIKNVLVAFVGSMSSSGEVSCIVGHGRDYEQRRADGTVFVQQLEPARRQSQGERDTAGPADRQPRPAARRPDIVHALGSRRWR